MTTVWDGGGSLISFKRTIEYNRPHPLHARRNQGRRIEPRVGWCVNFSRVIRLRKSS